MGVVQSAERRRPWEEKNVVVAGVLAYLIPGAGHLYQGRLFKAAIYFFCILGTFFGGMKLGEGAVVYNSPNNKLGVSLQFLAQVCVGLPALPAVQQAKRAGAPNNQPMHELRHPLAAPFTGQLVTSGPGDEIHFGALEGRIELQPANESGFADVRGKFTGTLDGKPVDLDLSGGFLIDRPIGAGFQRKLSCGVARGTDLHPLASQTIRGSIPRSLIDAYAAPPDAATLHDLHGRLGKFYDLAIALTMIAGLLNILAVWDAIEGPAYGFGDEVLTADDEAAQVTASASKPSDPSPATGAATAPARR